MAFIKGEIEMAIKIIETENGKVITKTSKQVRRERRIRKISKGISVAATVLVFVAMASITVFAATSGGDNQAPEGVQTETMSGLSNIIWWLVRIAVLATGGPTGVIKIANGSANEDTRERNAGISILVIIAALFGATFVIQGYIGI